MSMEKMFAERTKGANGSAISGAISILKISGVISFAGEMPDPNTFPNDELLEVSPKFIKDNYEQSLQYGATLLITG